MSTAAASESVSSLRGLLDTNPDADTISTYLNDLPVASRHAQVLGLTTARVGRLYACCAGARAVTSDDIVPTNVPDGKTVVHQGRNSLPMFNDFQKRFARMASGEIAGYNHQSMQWITGPGFFVVRDAHAESDVPEELYFDYTSVPADFPSEWPSYKPNDSGLSNLVYKGMKDYMRYVADGVTVGEAYKRGKSEGQFFILCRIDS